MTHKATPEQWATQQRWAADGGGTHTCILELRDRLAVQEAQRETEKACIQEIYDKLDRLKAQHESNWARIVKLEAAADHFPDAKKMVAAPAGGLMERVAQAIATDSGQPLHSSAIAEWSDEARAAILAVAEWLDTRGQHGCSLWLREEVERG
jgi:hypothetical protein